MQKLLLLEKSVIVNISQKHEHAELYNEVSCVDISEIFLTNILVLLLNLFSDQDSNSNHYFVANIDLDTTEIELCEVSLLSVYRLQLL